MFNVREKITHIKMRGFFVWYKDKSSAMCRVVVVVVGLILGICLLRIFLVWDLSFYIIYEYL